MGIETERGFIKVNDRLETSVREIYAIGDVTGKVMLAHAANVCCIEAGIYNRRAGRYNPPSPNRK